MTEQGEHGCGERRAEGELLELAERVAGGGQGRRAARGLRVARASRPTCGPTTARSSRCRRPVGRAWASGSWSGGRQGFAYAGSLDETADADPGRGPRQRHLRHARRARGPGRARRRGAGLARPVGRRRAAHCRRGQGRVGARARAPGRAAPIPSPAGGLRRLRRHGGRVRHRHLDRDRGHRPAHVCSLSVEAIAGTTPTARPASGSARRRAGTASTSKGGGRRRRARHPPARARPRCARGAAPWCSTPGSPPRCWPSCPRRCRARR